jgi:hypothetical protein
MVIHAAPPCVQPASVSRMPAMTPISGRPRPALRALCGATLALAVAGTEATTPLAEWDFKVRLDGKDIGTHRFVLASAGQRSTSLTSDAQFDVTLLGIPLYRYRHRVSERWSDGCLASIDASTDDNGRVTEVRGKAQSGRFELDVRGEGPLMPAPAAPTGCLVSFAYWNPSALAGQKVLLDPGTGRIQPVEISSPAVVPADLDGHGQPLGGLRIGGLAQPIDVWYAGDRWVGLDTVVDGGRRLSYRLR